MREALFRLWALVLGLALTGTLIYGLAAFPPQTITQTMSDSTPFRITLTVCVILQIIVWFLCIWAKREIESDTASWAFLALSVAVISWIALSTILTDATHIVFVGICVTALLIFLLLLMKMTSHHDSVIALRVSVLILIASIVSMIVLYNNNHFFVPEYVAFLTYSLIFTIFFITHTQDRWAKDELKPDTYPTDIDWDDPCCDPGEAAIPLAFPSNQKGSFYVGRSGALWVPQRI